MIYVLTMEFSIFHSIVKSKNNFIILQALPQEGIQMISGILHSHLFGQKIRLRHIRNGKELPTILEDNHYDFNFQASR